MRQFLVNLFEKIYDHSRSKDGDPDNIFFCEDTSYFRLGENTLQTSLTTDTCDFVLLSAMALKAPRLEICQKCVTQWYCTLLLESLNSSGSSCIPSMAVHSNMKPGLLFSASIHVCGWWLHSSYWICNGWWVSGERKSRRRGRPPWSAVGWERIWAFQEMARCEREGAAALPV